MTVKSLFGDRDLDGAILKNYTFTVFADLAAANLVVGTVFGFAYISDVGLLYYNQTGMSWQPVGAKGSKGDTGATGAPGTPGADGNTVLHGTSAPTTQGVDGDFFINTAASTIYGPKTGGAWGSPTSMTGATGASGNTILHGTVAPTTEGVNGDFYLLTTTMLMYGPKAGGVWPGSPTSLIGPAGPTGAAGVAGVAGPPGTSTGTDAAYGAPGDRTTTTAGPPVAPPVILVGIRYNFDTTNKVMYRWNGSIWVATSANYLDMGFQKFYVQDTTQPNGWLFGTNVGPSPVVTPIITTTGQITLTDLVTIVPVDSTGGPITITLQTTPYEGQVIEFKDISGKAELNPITVIAHGTDKLDHVTTGSFVIDQANGSARLLYATCNTSPVTTPVPGWWLLSFYRPSAATAVTINSATPLDVKRDQTILYDVSGGAFAITLPASPLENDRVRFKNKTNSTNVLTITGTIDGVVNPTYSTAYQLIVVEYLGGAWRKMN